MTQGHFLKIFKDAKLKDKTLLSTTRIDIIFNKIKGKGHSKVNFEQFLEGVLEASRTKKCDLKEMCDALKQLQGPHYEGTKTIPTHLHDDKEGYTGVHKNGGPSNVDKEIDRTPDLGFGLKKENQENESKN